MESRKLKPDLIDQWQSRLPVLFLSSWYCRNFCYWKPKDATICSRIWFH